MASIESILAEVDQLKPVSDVAGKVMALLEDPDSSIADLSDIIRHEPALTANVLKLANSAYYGLPGKISDAKQAIIYLGMTQVVDLVLMVCCATSFAGSHDGYGLGKGQLWSSAVSTAILASDLAEIKGLKNHGLLFTGALLRDIGKIVLDPYVGKAIEKIQHRIDTQSIAFSEAERLVLGLDHNQVGAMIAEKWHFPPALQCIIRHYHFPLEAKGCFVDAAIVHIANAIRCKMGIGVSVDDFTYPDDQRVADAVGLDQSDWKHAVDGFEAKIQRVQTLFGLS